MLEVSSKYSSTYSNLPKLKNYSIWLNTGLNLRYFRDSEDKFNYGNIKYYIDNNEIKENDKYGNVKYFIDGSLSKIQLYALLSII